MSDFEQSQWANPAFSREFLDNADHYIPDRFHLFHVLRSFYRFFIARPGETRICELGCGDGILADQLLRENALLEVTLVDGSKEMLDAARRRFAERRNIRYVQRGFDDLTEDSSDLGKFHFTISSFAIHHLQRNERRALFGTAFRHLESGGCFMNVEAALPDHVVFTEWYYQLWQEWIDRRSQMLGLGDKFHEVPRKARDNPDNQYSPLADQLADLTASGFVDVECHYKNGIFAIYTGRRP
jgi:tRNA (cmo5U34)-methyltransferase